MDMSPNEFASIAEAVFTLIMWYFVISRLCKILKFFKGIKKSLDGIAARQEKHAKDFAQLRSDFDALAEALCAEG